MTICGQETGLDIKPLITFVCICLKPVSNKIWLSVFGFMIICHLFSLVIKSLSDFRYPSKLVMGILAISHSPISLCVLLIMANVTNVTRFSLWLDYIVPQNL